MTNQEIERKFLVKNKEFKTHSFREDKITQGYLSSVPERTVRVRIKNKQGFLTIKGIGNKSGMTRFEWEKEIPIKEAKSLLAICESEIIDKIRYNIKVGKHIFEVDEFFGVNKDLVIAEIELNLEDEKFEKPDWLGKEVTGDVKYYNSYLTKHPFTSW